MFPIGDDNVKGGVFPYVTYAFLAINVLVFLFIQLPIMFQGEDAVKAFYNIYAGDPCELKAGTDWFTAITSMFLHGGIWHIIGNMLFLWVFADNIESTIGHIRFIIFYLLGGITAVLAHTYLGSGGDCTPMVGASGAIAAVLGAYFVMFPGSRIKLWAILFTFRLVAWLFLGLWIGQQFLAVLANVNMDKVQGGGIAWWAHIGGFIFGIFAGLYFKVRFPKIKSFMDNVRKQREYRSVKIPPKRYNNRFG